jgi:cell division protein FtsW
MDPSIYRLRQRDILTFCVLALLCLGVIMVQSASMSVSGDLGWRWSQLGIKQVAFSVVGIIAFFVVGHRDYAWLGRRRRLPFAHESHESSRIKEKHRSGSFVKIREIRGQLSFVATHPIVWFLLLTAVLNLLVLVPHIGISKNGARRWLPMGFTQLQPSELAKWVVVLFLAWWLTARPVDTTKFFRGFLPTLVPVGFMCLLIVIQDFGTAALIAVCALTMLLAGRIKLWHLLVVLPPVLCAGAWFVMHKEYRWKRMTAFLDPWANPQREGYHMIQSLLSFSTGGITGRGLGNGIQKLGYLPEDTTDFIFAVICEELGLFGALLTVALYLGVLYVAWQVVKQTARDDFGRLLAFGIASMIGLQATINIAVATVSVPTKGLSLPLISAGGSGIVITCAALGLLYSITKHRHTREEEGSEFRGQGSGFGQEKEALTPFDLITPEPALSTSSPDPELSDL